MSAAGQGARGVSPQRFLPHQVLLSNKYPGERYRFYKLE
jgi:hypothetical protein